MSRKSSLSKRRNLRIITAAQAWQDALGMYFREVVKLPPEEVSPERGVWGVPDTPQLGREDYRVFMFDGKAVLEGWFLPDTKQYLIRGYQSSDPSP